VSEEDDEYMSRVNGKWYPAKLHSIGQPWCLMMPYRRPMHSIKSRKKQPKRIGEMKKYFVLSFIVLLFGCDNNRNPAVHEYEYLNHSYLVFSEYGHQTYVHDPDCKCSLKKGINNEQN
jgi:hypothetical protein